jgi:hypothetical protein
MASTYTPKLNLAKPAHGDVNWHIPINGNWDKIDTELDKANSVTTTTVTLIPYPCIWYQDNVSKTTDSESYTVLKTAKAVPAGFSGIVTVYWVNYNSSKK